MEAAASIIGVVQLGDRVLALCGHYVSEVRGAKQDIERFIAEVASLQNVLKQADELAQKRVLNLHSHSLVQELADLTSGCRATLEELECELSSVNRGHMHKVMSRIGMRALKWPFKKEEVTNIIDALNRHKGTITLALNLDQRSDSS